MATTDPIEWRLLDTDLTTVLRILPVLKGNIYLQLNEPGSGDVELLLDTESAADITSGRFVQASYRGAVRGGFFIENIDTTHADSNEGAGRTITASGRGALALLDDAIVWDDGSGKTKREFENMTMADVLIVLIEEAKGRGCYANLSYDFTAIDDSNSIPWTDTGTYSLSVGTSMLDVVRQFAKGMDFSINPGTGEFILSAFISGSYETDLSKTIYFRVGTNCTEVKSQEVANDVRNALRVQYGDGFLTVKDCNSVSSNRRKEGLTDASNGGNSQTATIIGMAELEAKKEPKYSRSVSVYDGISPFIFIDYDMGNRVSLDVFGVLNDYRILGLQLSWNEAEYAAVTVDLNSIITDTETKLAERVRNLRDRFVTAHDADLLDTTFWAAFGETNNATQMNDIKINQADGLVYVGGSFSQMGNIPSNNIAMYNILTSVWTALGEGVGGTVYRLEVIGSDVYAIWTYSSLQYISKWDGATWTTIAWDTGDMIYCSGVLGIDLLVGGDFISGHYDDGGFPIRKWNGSTWSDLGKWFNHEPRCIAVSDTADVYVGGDFTGANGTFDGAGGFPGGVLVNHIAKLSFGGTDWEPLGITGVDDSVAAIGLIGDVVYAGGAFLQAGGPTGMIDTNHIARFTPTIGWEAMEGGMDSECGAAGANGVSDGWGGEEYTTVYTIATNMTDVYIGGNFQKAGGVAAKYLCRWNGQTFEPVESGLNMYCYGIAIYNLLDVYMVGAFSTAGDMSANKVVAWLTTFESIVQHASGQYVHPNHFGDVVSDGDRGTTIQLNVVHNTMLEDVPTATFKGRYSAATGDPEDLTVIQARALIFPDYAGNDGKVLAVNGTEDGVEWITGGGGGVAPVSPSVAGNVVSFADTVGTQADSGIAVADLTTLTDGSNADALHNHDVGASIHAATVETILDADEIGFSQSASWLLKKITWANIKSSLATWANGLYLQLVGGTLTGALAIAVAAGVKSFKILDGASEKFTLSWSGNTITMDLPSIEPVNKIVNGTFDTDLSSWSDDVVGGYVLNDEFTTDRAAGAVNGTSAEPTGGTRTVTDTNSKISIASSILNFATGGVADNGIWYSSSTRAAGKVLTQKVIASDTNGIINVGFDTNTSGAINDRLIFDTAGVLKIAPNGGTAITVGAYTADTYYIAGVMRATGFYWLIKGGAFTNWTLLYITALGTADGIPSLTAGSTTSIFTADNIRIPTSTWLPTPLAYDTFTRADGAIGNSETTGPDSQTTPSLAWTGGAISGNKNVITPTLGSELVTNGDMETGSPPTGWTAQNGSTLSSEADERTGGAGSKSLGIIRGTGNSAARQVLSTVTGNWYQVSVWAKNGTAYSNSVYFDSAFSFVNPPSVPVDTWYDRFAVTRLNTGDAINLYNYKTGGEKVGFDDISIKPLTLSSLFSTVSTSDSDVIADANVTLTAGTQAGLVLNLDSTSSPANFIIVYHDGTSVKVDEAVAGVYTNKQTTTVTYSAGATLRAIREGTKLRVYYNNALVGAELTMTANTNTKHGLFSTYSGNSFDNFTLWPRGSGTTKFTDAPFEELTATRDTGTKYAGSASAKLVAGGVNGTCLQSINVANTATYNYIGYVNTGGVPTQADLQLYYNGVLTTTFTSVGSGWYRMEASFTGINAAKDIGVKVYAGKTVYVDSLAAQAGYGDPTTLYITNSGTGHAHVDIEATTTMHSADASEAAGTSQGAVGQTGNIHDFKDSDGNLMAAIAKNGALKLPELADADAENSTWYYSTTQSKAVFKDSGGTIHALY